MATAGAGGSAHAASAPAGIANVGGIAGGGTTSATVAKPLKFKLGRGSAAPKQSVPISTKPIRIKYRFRATRATPISIRIVRVKSNGHLGATARRYTPGRQRPGKWHSVKWAGRLKSGRLAHPGSYKVEVGPVGGPLRGLGHLRLHGHVFPVDAPHGTRGAIGQFGAPRVDGRTHEGFDITGNCGSPLVAVRSGRVIETGYDPELYGNYVVMKGDEEHRTYKYAHMKHPTSVREGQHVKADHRFGSIGQTGNAAGTPCHLHFEIRENHHLVNPEPIVNSWEW